MDFFPTELQCLIKEYVFCPRALFVEACQKDDMMMVSYLKRIDSDAIWDSQTLRNGFRAACEQGNVKLLALFMTLDLELLAIQKYSRSFDEVPAIATCQFFVDEIKRLEQENDDQKIQLYDKICDWRTWFLNACRQNNVAVAECIWNTGRIGKIDFPHLLICTVGIFELMWDNILPFAMPNEKQRLDFFDQLFSSVCSNGDYELIQKMLSKRVPKKIIPEAFATVLKGTSREKFSILRLLWQTKTIKANAMKQIIKLYFCSQRDDTIDVLIFLEEMHIKTLLEVQDWVFCYIELNWSVWTVCELITVLQQTVQTKMVDTTKLKQLVPWFLDKPMTSDTVDLYRFLCDTHLVTKKDFHDLKFLKEACKQQEFNVLCFLYFLDIFTDECLSVICITCQNSLRLRREKRNRLTS